MLLRNHVALVLGSCALVACSGSEPRNDTDDSLTTEQPDTMLSPPSPVEPPPNTPNEPSPGAPGAGGAPVATPPAGSPGGTPNVTPPPSDTLLPPAPATTPGGTVEMPGTAPIDPTVPMASGGASPASAGGGGTPAGGTGAGGSPGGASSGGSASGGSPVAVDGEELFREDFEAQTVGEAPTGWDNFIGWQKNNPMPTADNYARVEELDGSKVIHFVGGTNPAQLTRALPQGTTKIYVTARVKMSRQLGQNPGANHETLIAIRGESGSANNEIRFGEIKGVIGTNEVPSDNISPLMDQWGMGPAVAADAWACFEVAFIGDQAQHELHAWVDGELVHSITAPDQWQNGAMPANWMDGKFLEVVFGWHSFSSENIDVWMDDLVVATERRGCE